MITSEEIIGTYYIFQYRTKVEAHTYKLEVYPKDEKNQLNFKLYLIKSGHFGSVGLEWLGTYVLKGDQIIFKSEQQIDWNYTFLDEERNDHIYQCSKIYTGNLFKEDTDIKLVLEMETNTLFFYKSEYNFEGLTYWIIQRIIEHFHLDTTYGKNEPGLFWRISNLILMNFISIDIDNADHLEAKCEFDLETVKEEKRVIDNDEIVSRHLKGKVIFNKLGKLTDYTILEGD